MKNAKEMFNGKIKITDTMYDIIIKLSEGNPGALSFLFEIIKYYGNDQANLIADFLIIDNMRLYGSYLYMLWNDCCNRDVKKSLEVIKGYRLGHIKDSDIKERIINVGYGMPFDDLIENR